MSRESRNLPSFIPSFSVDQQSGGLQANPAGSVAIAKMERLLRDRDEARASFLSERGLQSRRQASLDKYYAGRRQGDLVKMGPRNKLSELPMIASPQPIYNFKKTELEQNVLNNRESQLRGFGNSFMKTKVQFIHEEIDDAYEKCAARGEEVRAKQRGPHFRELLKSDKQKRLDGGFSKKEKEYIFAPLEDSISWLNKVFLEDKFPVQVRWREVWRSEGESAKELFMVFANAEYQHEGSQKSWSGMREVL